MLPFPQQTHTPPGDQEQSHLSFCSPVSLLGRRSMWAGPPLTGSQLSPAPSIAPGTQWAPHRHLGSGWRGCPGNFEEWAADGGGGAHLSLEARGFRHIHRWAMLRAEGSARRKASNLPANPSSPRQAVCPGQVTFPLCASVCSSAQWRRWQGPVRVAGAGSADPTGRRAHSRRRINARATAAGAGKGLKPGAF